MTDEIVEEIHRPSGTALEKGELERRKPPRYPPHEQPLADCFIRGSELPNVIEDVIGDGHSAPPTRRVAVEARQDPELLAHPPHVVVIVRTVQAQVVDPETTLRGPIDRLARPTNRRRHHGNPQPQRP